MSGFAELGCGDGRGESGKKKFLTRIPRFHPPPASARRARQLSAAAKRPEACLSRFIIMTTSLQSTPREPPFPRAAEIDECVADASSRVKRLHGLLTQWQLADMSQEQSSHLLAYVEEVLQHTRESSSALAAYDETIQQSLGPELCQACISTPPYPAA